MRMASSKSRLAARPQRWAVALLNGLVRSQTKRGEPSSFLKMFPLFASSWISRREGRWRCGIVLINRMAMGRVGPGGCSGWRPLRQNHPVAHGANRRAKNAPASTNCSSAALETPLSRVAVEAAEADGACLRRGPEGSSRNGGGCARSNIVTG